MKFPLRVVALFVFLFYGGKTYGQADSLRKTIAKANRLLESSLKKIGQTAEPGLSNVKAKQGIEKSTVQWKALALAYPNNANVQFKLGLCYFNTVGKNLEALDCFQKACKKMGPNFIFRKTQDFAPFYAQYFLAECFRLNNQPDSAIRNYSEYRNKYRVPPISSEKEVYMAINAKLAENNPRNVNLTNFFAINAGSYDAFPVLTMDNKQVFFASDRGSTKSMDVYFSKMDSSGRWSNPIPLPFSSKSDEVPVFVNIKGDILYLRVQKGKQSDIYYTQLKDGQWSKPKPFGLVNSSYNENGMCLSLDGNQLFFSSDRSGGTGGYDIYLTKRDSAGTWSSPQNLAFPINTGSDECYPNLSIDGKTLFYSSNGLINIGVGGFDVFYTNLLPNGKWSNPQSLNKPINGPGDDIGFYHSGEGKRFFSQLNKDQSFDIISIDGGEFEAEEIAVATEVVTVTNELNVAQIVETEKEVEKEIAVVETVETEKEVEKEVEVTKEIEVEQDLKKLDVAALDTITQQSLVDKVKDLLDKKDSVAAVVVPTTENPSQATQTLVSNPNSENLTSEGESVPSKMEAAEDATPLSLSSPGLEEVRVLYFDLNRYEIQPGSKSILKAIATFLKENPDWMVEVVGHSDQRGEWETNLELSIKRAKTIKEHLGLAHISLKRIRYFGVGNTQLKTDGLDEDSRRLNRRAEIRLIPKKKQ